MLRNIFKKYFSESWNELNEWKRINEQFYLNNI